MGWGVGHLEEPSLCHSRGHRPANEERGKLLRKIIGGALQVVLVRPLSEAHSPDSFAVSQLVVLHLSPFLQLP